MRRMVVEMDDDEEEGEEEDGGGGGGSVIISVPSGSGSTRTSTMRWASGSSGAVPMPTGLCSGVSAWRPRTS